MNPSTSAFSAAKLPDRPDRTRAKVRRLALLMPDHAGQKLALAAFRPHLPIWAQ
jgi:hypothetical protein